MEQSSIHERNNQSVKMQVKAKRNRKTERKKNAVKINQSWQYQFVKKTKIKKKEKKKEKRNRKKKRKKEMNEEKMQIVKRNATFKVLLPFSLSSTSHPPPNRMSSNLSTISFIEFFFFSKMFLRLTHLYYFSSYFVSIVSIFFCFFH